MGSCAAANLSGSLVRSDVSGRYDYVEDDAAGAGSSRALGVGRFDVPGRWSADPPTVRKRGCAA